MKRWIYRAMLVAALSMTIGPASAAAEEHFVTVQSNIFDPAMLTIAPGDIVTWTNQGGVHNVRADDDSFRCANGCDDDKGDGSPSPNAWSFSLEFNEVGSNPYYCEIHGAAGGIGMSGVVDVMAPTQIFTDGFESGDTSSWTVTVP